MEIIVFIQMWLEFTPKGIVHNMSALVQIIAWHKTGNELLPQAMMTQFTDWYIYMCVCVTMHASKSQQPEK